MKIPSYEVKGPTLQLSVTKEILRIYGTVFPPKKKIITLTFNTLSNGTELSYIKV